MSWLSLVLTPRRLILALMLLPFLIPSCFGLAWGLERIVTRGRGWQAILTRGAAWLGVALVLWGTHYVLINGGRPLFGIPVVFTVASFVLPLPLWLLPSRPGMTLARAVSHAGASAWLLASYLPFVQEG
jgi:hypothetical protein